jgi:lipopolysaccharide heptosyltransferase II
MNIKNFLIKSLIRLVKRYRKKEISLVKGQPPRFLVVSTTGLGDTLWGTPALRALREKHPRAYIAVLTSSIGHEILRHNPHADQIFVLKNSSFISLLTLYFSLKRKKIHTVLIFHTSQRLVLPLCFLIGARTLIGTKGINKGLDFILTHGLENTPVHEIARRLEIIGQVGAQARNPLLELYLSDEDKHSAEKFLQEHGIPDYIPIVGLQPGAKDKFKQWPPESFIDIGNRLKDHLGCQIVVTGSASEKNLVEKIARKIPGSIALHGELSLCAAAALIKKMSLMISNDTGPMHIAFAMQTPTIALFAPTDPKRCGPYFASRTKVIEKQTTCAPCLRKKCQDPFCLLQIGTQEVYDEALKLFYNEKDGL